METIKDILISLLIEIFIAFVVPFLFVEIKESKGISMKRSSIVIFAMFLITALLIFSLALMVLCFLHN